MVGNSLSGALSSSLVRRLAPAVIMLSALAAACGVGPKIPPTAQVEPQASPTALNSAGATATEPAAQVSGPSVTSVAMGFCFAYPEGFALVANNDELVEVSGSASASNPQPALAWVNAADAKGRTAQEVANEEVNAGGLNPPRSTVMLGGEEALVLDGMPGQDAIRKVYIVHAGRLYTLMFSPYKSDDSTANAQMETLYSSLMSSWVWTSSGTHCPGSG